ncbi:MAG: pentapeptide repeat-containing protein [Desulfarculus sp.]|nr:pentapeptide repeat-containing protein [Desulfarculus sp.]
MANPEHLAMLAQGVEAWNKWREENPAVTQDLRQARLGKTHLFGANLSGANLSRAYLGMANLGNANLCMAKLRGANLSGANLNGANLSGANLSLADLSRADLIDANLCGANLRQADLRAAKVWSADLTRVDLNGAKISHADLIGANLSGANLRQAYLSTSSLISANLSGADLSGAYLDDANLSGWIIKDVICTHIMQRGQRIDFAPGEFEKKYTWLESVAEVMLRLPLSDLTLYAGPLMAQAVNQAHGQAVVQFKGVEALSDDTTSLKFVLFAQAQEEIKASLHRLEEAINNQAPALAAHAPDEPGDIIKWRNSWGPSWSPVVVDLQAAEAALVRRFSMLPPSLQTLWQIMQAALKP